MRAARIIGLVVVTLATTLAVPAVTDARRSTPKRARGIRGVDFANRTYATEHDTIRLVRGRAPGRGDDDRPRLARVTYGRLGQDQECALVVLEKENGNVAQTTSYYYLFTLTGGKPVQLWWGEGGKGEENFGVQAATLLSRTLIVDTDENAAVHDCDEGQCCLPDLTRRTYWLVTDRLAVHSTAKLVYCPRPPRAAPAPKRPAPAPRPATAPSPPRPSDPRRP